MGETELGKTELGELWRTVRTNSTPSLVIADLSSTRDTPCGFALGKISMHRAYRVNQGTAHILNFII